MAMSYLYGGNSANKVQQRDEVTRLPVKRTRHRKKTGHRNPIVNKKTVETWGDGTPRVMGNDVQPFYRGASAPGDRAGHFTRTLGRFTGTDSESSHRPPRSSGPMFEPVRDLGNVNGHNNDRSIHMDTVKRSVYGTHNNGEYQPEPIRVGPGLGVSMTQDHTLSLGRGGYQQAASRQHIIPKTIDELRVKTKPRISYGGRTVSQGASFVQKRATDHTDVRGKRLPVGVGRIGTAGGMYNNQKVNSMVVMRDTVRGDEIPNAARLGAIPHERQQGRPDQRIAAPGHVSRQALDTHNHRGIGGISTMSKRRSAAPGYVSRQSLDTHNHRGIGGITTMSERVSAAPGYVNRQSLDTQNYGGIGGITTMSERVVAAPGPISRQALDTQNYGGIAGITTVTGASQHREALGTAPRDTREQSGRLAGAKNTTVGVQSYEHIYNATLSELRGTTEAPKTVPGTRSVVPAANNRHIEPGVQRGDRADVLVSRTAGAQHRRMRADGDTGGLSIRKRRAVDAEGVVQGAISAVPFAKTVAPDSIHTRGEGQTFVAHSSSDLDLASEQMLENPLHVPIG